MQKEQSLVCESSAICVSNKMSHLLQS